MRQASFMVFVIIAATSIAQAEQAVRVVVESGETPRRNVPVTLVIEDAAITRSLRGSGSVASLATDDASSPIVAQMHDAPGQPLVLRWIEPQLQPAQAKHYTLRPAAKTDAPQFQLKPGEGFRDLLRGGQGVLRHMTRYDPADHANTFKPFHHVFGFDGHRFITNGPGGDEWGATGGKDIRFPHHRGLFFGYNKTPFGDFWHGKDGVSQRHIYYDEMHEFAGPVAAREVGVCAWVAKDGKPVIRDHRRFTTWAIDPACYVLDVDVTLESLTGEPIKLSGDAQHAGFHFRAADEVGREPATSAASTAPTTRRGTGGGAAKYTRPASAVARGNDIWADCPWVYCEFTIQGKPYGVMQMNGPDNPQPTVFSTRPYGRFGAFADNQVVAPEKPLKFSYRFVIRDASTPADAGELESLYRDFVSPVKASAGM